MRASPPSPRTLAVLLATVAAALTVATMRRSGPTDGHAAGDDFRRTLARGSIASRATKDAAATRTAAVSAAASGSQSQSQSQSQSPPPRAAPQTGSEAEDVAKVEAKGEIEVLLARLADDPNDQEALDRLASLHLADGLRDEIFAAVSRLYHENPGSHVLAEALGTLCHQEERYEEAAEHLRRAADYTNRPMRVRTLLTYVELKSGDFAAARETARETRAMLNGYLTGKRDKTLIKEEIKDEYMQVPCYFEAIAAAKSDDIEGAKRALATCGDGVLSEADRQRLIEDANVEGWPAMDIDDILD